MVRLFVSETEFDRAMQLIVEGTQKGRTITFPSTVRETAGNAFWKR